nr:hypothetical protein [uncultured Albidiferax sp.]
MAVNSVTSASTVPGPQKASALTPVDSASGKKPASKDSTAGEAEAVPSASFNVKMPVQPTSNALGQTIGQHLNLKA